MPKGDDFDRDRMRVITLSVDIDRYVEKELLGGAFEKHLRSLVTRALGEKLFDLGAVLRTTRADPPMGMRVYTFEAAVLLPLRGAQEYFDRAPYLDAIAEPIARTPDPPAPPPAPPPDHSKDWLTKLAGKNVVPKK